VPTAQCALPTSCHKHIHCPPNTHPLNVITAPLWYFGNFLHSPSIPIYVYPKTNCAISVQFSTFMCLWAVYIFLGSVNIISCSRIGRLNVGIYKSLTDTWIWKSGLRPCNSFSGNICFEFSVLCLCSVLYVLWSNLTVLCHCEDGATTSATMRLGTICTAAPSTWTRFSTSPTFFIVSILFTIVLYMKSWT
jgi:hypothetical protein